MKKTLFALCFLALGVLVIAVEHSRKIPQAPLREGCIFCHEKTTDPDPSHPIEAFACSSCHLGNAYAYEKDRAHVAMVKNPGDLGVAEQTCGKPRCHPGIVDRVKKSVMATNRGILGALRRHWPDGHLSAGTDIPVLLAAGDSGGLAEDYFRKMCAGCHLWKPKGDRPGEAGLRGGGCADCHVPDSETKARGLPRVAENRMSLQHPSLSTRIPSDNCVKCHNRSARIGLSYFGRFESAGYGTPYDGGRLSRRRLSGRRFYIELPADAHLRKAGLDCIDCHTATGLMGDGKVHERMEGQLDITCEACHLPSMGTKRDKGELADRLARLNRKVPRKGAYPMGWSRKGTPLYNLRGEKGKIILRRKRDGKSFEIKVAQMDGPHHALKGHDRLSCQACHSAWMPQCYGCHLAYRRSESQRDWLTGKESKGRWRETRSFMRFSKPALGVRDGDRVYPIAPCQVFFSDFEEGLTHRPGRRFQVLSLGAFDPHTTSKASRGCLECHGDPKALGLGEGILYWKKGRPEFRPTYETEKSGLEHPLPLDGFTRLGQKGLAAISSGDPRPFHGEEIERILRVGACAGCHRRYDDGIYRDFQQSLKRFREEDLPCLR